MVYDQANCCPVIVGALSYFVSALCPKERKRSWVGTGYGPGFVYCVGYLLNLFLVDGVIRQDMEGQSSCAESLSKTCISWEDRKSSKMPSYC